jgi:hypothetical protein
LHHFSTSNISSADPATWCVCVCVCCVCVWMSVWVGAEDAWVRRMHGCGGGRMHGRCAQRASMRRERCLGSCGLGCS